MAKFQNLQSIFSSSKRVNASVRRYHSQTGGDFVYLVAMDYRSDKDRSRLGVAIASLLWGWNFRVASQGNLMGNVRDALRKSRNYVEDLGERDLATIDLDLFSDSIRGLYRIFANERYQSIGWTGAAKALHVVKPDLFVPWDGGIRDVYHSAHRRADRHRSSLDLDWYEDCYFAFLRQCQVFARILASYGTHSSVDTTLMDDAKPVLAPHPLGNLLGKVPLTKVIDECNWLFCHE